MRLAPGGRTRCSRYSLGTTSAALRSTNPLRRRGLQAIPKVILALSTLLAATALPAAAQGKVVLVGHPAVIIDPSCNAAAAGTTMLKLRNEGPAGSAPVPIYLATTELVSKPPARHLLAKMTLSPTTTASGDRPSAKAALAPGEEQWVKLEVSGVYDDGEWETTLQNESLEVGPVRIVRPESPFHVSLDVAKPEAPELTMVEGRPAHFSLKNEDNQDYILSWQYSIDGVSVSSATPQKSGPACGQQRQSPSPGADIVRVPAKGLREVSFTPAASWFPSCFTGLFKDRVGDGLLVVSRQLSSPVIGRTNDECGAATKTFKVKTNLASSTGNSREFLSDLVVFIFLLVGGLCSLALNFVFPNQARRLKLNVALAELGRNIGDLSTRLASRPRVLVGLGARLLGDRLHKLTLANGDFASEILSLEQAAGRLGTRIQLLDRLGTLRDDFERLESQALPPTRILAMEDMFAKIVAIVNKSDPSDGDVQSAQALIGDLQKQLDNAGSADDTLAADIARRFKSLKGDLDRQSGSIGKTPTCIEIRGRLGGLFNVIDNSLEDHIGPDRYVTLDIALFKLDYIRSFISLVENITDASDPFRGQLTGRKGEFLDLLKKDGWQSLSAARSLLFQMKEGKFVEDIAQAVDRRQVKVRPGRFEIRQFEPCGFRLEFVDATLNKATARNEWICQWKFSNPQELPLIEYGWEVTHYFKNVGSYGLMVTLVPAAASIMKETEVGNIAPLTVLPEIVESSRRMLGRAPATGWQRLKAWWRLSSQKLEVLRLLLALFIALVALIAGAKEQLLKLDVIPALIAIFFVGFSADQIKNLLTQRQSPPETGVGAGLKEHRP
jgi:hypothetical protein